MIMLLTEPQSQASITPKPVTSLLEYSYKSMGRLNPVKSKGVGYAPLGTWLFLCPKTLLSTLKNSSSLWWGGLLERYILYTAVQPTILPHRPKTEPFSGGLSISKGISHMTSFSANKPTVTAIALVETSTIIGTAIDCNGLFTQQLADSIDSYGIPLADLTVFQLINLINKHRTEFNKQKTPTKKHSLFNILASDTKKVIADSLTYDQAIQYRDPKKYVIKFAHMVGGAV